MVEAEGNTVIAKLDELEHSYQEHVGGYQIGIIPSLGKGWSSVDVVDNSDEAVEEDCNVENTEKEEEDQESDGTVSSLADLEEEIMAVTAKLEALKKKHARHVERKSKHKLLEESSPRKSSIVLKKCSRLELFHGGTSRSNNSA
ncbi:uncharacterized protein LOC132304106 [Cornus florida]|uniref:uncharacterized protein LOC132304106 n=1 Tax=Cornus florida TaxID=4283 RepID=UPI0028A13FCD|nr:uncharacterized protein LOC132304106 [Cornus florida]